MAKKEYRPHEMKVTINNPLREGDKFIEVICEQLFTHEGDEKPLEKISPDFYRQAGLFAFCKLYLFTRETC